MACFDGQYPIELPAGNLIGKHVLEGVGKRAAMPSATPQEATAAVAELEAEYEAARASVDVAPASVTTARRSLLGTRTALRGEP